MCTGFKALSSRDPSMLEMRFESEGAGDSPERRAHRSILGAVECQ